ncbi:hypothetical protein BT63DRAFT_27549 [Microthyrium microscopicum]|uniref:Uncharacterized protein n=1 Tax=Microthyrium microscopicum TaxID=703497 RepID=A0A6A6UUA1_9PEZI|nr:hypothetical protein BT63DRAFT_27549 [Microthyrium microscopicum]
MAEEVDPWDLDPETLQLPVPKEAKPEVKSTGSWDNSHSNQPSPTKEEAQEPAAQDPTESEDPWAIPGGIKPPDNDWPSVDNQAEIDPWDLDPETLSLPIHKGPALDSRSSNSYLKTPQQQGPVKRQFNSADSWAGVPTGPKNWREPKQPRDTYKAPSQSNDPWDTSAVPKDDDWPSEPVVPEDNNWPSATAKPEADPWDVNPESLPNKNIPFGNNDQNFNAFPKRQNIPWDEDPEFHNEPASGPAGPPAMGRSWSRQASSNGSRTLNSPKPFSPEPNSPNQNYSHQQRWSTKRTPSGPKSPSVVSHGESSARRPSAYTENQNPGSNLNTSRYATSQASTHAPKVFPAAKPASQGSRVCTTVPNGPPTVLFHTNSHSFSEDGDLGLILGDFDFQVDSMLLRRASSRFDSFLPSNEVFKSRTSPLAYGVPGYDGPDTNRAVATRWFILLSIVQFQAEKIHERWPYPSDLPNIYHTAKTAHEFDLADHLDRELRKRNFHSMFEELQGWKWKNIVAALAYAYSMSDNDLFRKLAKHIGTKWNYIYLKLAAENPEFSEDIPASF